MENPRLKPGPLSGRSMYSDMGDKISCDSYQATILISNAFNTGKKRQKGGEEGREREEEREMERRKRSGRSVINVLDSWHLLCSPGL